MPSKIKIRDAFENQVSELETLAAEAQQKLDTLEEECSDLERENKQEIILHEAKIATLEDKISELENLLQKHSK